MRLVVPESFLQVRYLLLNGRTTVMSWNNEERLKGGRQSAPHWDYHPEIVSHLATWKFWEKLR